jgi:hypothetical protein
MKSISLFSFCMSPGFAFSIRKKKNFVERHATLGNFSLLAMSWKMHIAPNRNRTNILSDVISLYRHGLRMVHQMGATCRATVPTQQWLAYGNDECDARKARTGVDA